MAGPTASTRPRPITHAAAERGIAWMFLARIATLRAIYRYQP
jgi:hypothetical protein